MAFIIFYSWQSKTDEKFNRYFIKDCLEEAAAIAKNKLGIQGPTLFIDHDTKDIAGIPNIPTTIEEKIAVSDIFVADLTLVSTVNSSLPPKDNRSRFKKIFGIDKPPQPKPVLEPSANVSQETGTALGNYMTKERIITIMNTTYGDSDGLHFDISQRRRPLTYSCDGKTPKNEIKAIRKNLITNLADIIKSVVLSEGERQKSYFKPFITYDSWGKLITRPFEFENSAYLSSVFDIFKNGLTSSRKIYRLCGLSGIGKTRLLYEFFSPSAGRIPPEVCQRLLYVNGNETDKKDIITVINNLRLREEHKILIIDNWEMADHSIVANIVSHSDSLLSVITVSPDPDEQISHIDFDGTTKQIILQSEEYKPIVEKLLETFTELQPDERKLLVEFSNGIPLIATIMAQNKDRANYQPGSLTKPEIVKRLLGPLYENDHDRAVIQACAIFSQIGYSDELAYQLEEIAIAEDICSLQFPNVHQDDVIELKRKKFRETCEDLQKRQLLEKKGRVVIFRPTPLAVRMAEEWWNTCTEPKFQRILPFLHKNRLVESFCEQFRYLKHVQNAKYVVGKLCDGLFSSAEVLNTNVGSRLFRSFVYVNPHACENALVKAFSVQSKESVIAFSEGRRNLVWALEKLCFRKETFEKCTKVLATLAIGENEHIGNNATNQFFQLFHIYLPGTAASLTQRIGIIDYCIASGGDYTILGLKAIGSALYAGNFHRMGGGEDQGDLEQLKDYSPTQKEIYHYWRHVISVLDTFLDDNEEFQNMTVSIVQSSFYGVCTFGGGSLFLHVIQKIIDRKLVDKVTMRKKLQFVLKSDRVTDIAFKQALDFIYQQLAPSTFEERFRLIIQAPTSEDYFERKNLTDGERNWQEKIDRIATDLLADSEKWVHLSPILTTGHIAEGYSFGKAIYRLALKDQIEAFLRQLITGLKETEAAKRNYSIFLGIIAEMGGQSLPKRLFHEILHDANVPELAFAIVRELPMSEVEIGLLLDGVEKGTISAALFLNFSYGWGLKHLESTVVSKIFDRLNSTGNDGKLVAFNILANWSVDNNSDTWKVYSELIRKLVLDNSELYLSSYKNSIDLRLWGEVAAQLIDQTDDTALANRLIDIIITRSNNLEDYGAGDVAFYPILDIVQKKYFGILWEKLSSLFLHPEDRGIAILNLKALLGQKISSTFGNHALLFRDKTGEDLDVIIAWCKENRDALHWVGSFLPIYGESTDGQSVWHPSVIKFIDTFGNEHDLLGAISATLGTYSWSGSVVPKLEDDKRLFISLLEHPRKDVRSFAKRSIENLEERIKWENNHNLDGIFI